MQLNNFQILISGSYNAFNEGWNGAGVYMASGCYVSETFKQPIYIGSANDIQRRILREHLSDLNNNNHDNQPFQRSWNKYNENKGFIWILLESCSPERQILLDTEQKYLDLYRPFVDEFGGFNIAHFASGGGLPGKELSFEHKEKLRFAKLGKKLSQEHKEKISKANIGKEGGMKGKRHSEETKKRMSESQKNTDRNRAVLKGENNPFYGKRHSLETKQKISRANLGRKASKQERRLSSKTKRERQINAKKHIFINPDKIKVEIFNLRKFCKDNNLDYACMWRVQTGKRKTHKGWTKYKI